jgi:hypothetical protein
MRLLSALAMLAAIPATAAEPLASSNPQLAGDRPHRSLSKSAANRG